MASNITYKSQKARDKAREHFGLGAGDDDFVLHHVDETLRHTNPERYNEWRPEDLCIMSRSEHSRLHSIGNKNCKGKTFSEEHKNKISSAALKKPVEQYTLAGELVRVWESAKQAEKEGGFHKSTIAKVCKGRLKQHKGYIWMYANK